MNGTLVELSRRTMETGCTDATSERRDRAWAADRDSTAENAFTNRPYRNTTLPPRDRAWARAPAWDARASCLAWRSAVPESSFPDRRAVRTRSAADGAFI